MTSDCFPFCINCFGFFPHFELCEKECERELAFHEDYITGCAEDLPISEECYFEETGAVSVLA